MIIKTLKITTLIAVCFFCSCASKQATEPVPKNQFYDIKSPNTDAQLVETEIFISEEAPDFINTTTNQKTVILQHLEETGFKAFNGMKFKTDSIGVLVGGAGMVVRITKNAGKTWNQYRFSEFGNSFYSVENVDDSFFVVGADEHIYKTSDLGENWSVYNTDHIFNNGSYSTPKLLKIRFLNSKVGCIVGEEKSSLPIVLLTTNGGDDWCRIDTTTLEFDNKYDRSNAVTDIKIINEKEIYVVTWSGQCFKTIDQGENWNLVYDNQDKILYAIDFKDATTGFIGESEKVFLTNDGAKTWTGIDLPEQIKGGNITNILYTKSKTLITTTSSYGERNAFVYAIYEGDTIARPFLTKKDSVDVFFEGDSHSIDVLDDSVFILDRNNLYKTALMNKK